ncbi:Protoporphyrinogen oxidase [Sesbania bispinosa]|nr:Protoporphyrinogen oxidase [Sesbania bispinosa]
MKFTTVPPTTAKKHVHWTSNFLAVPPIVAKNDIRWTSNVAAVFQPSLTLLALEAVSAKVSITAAIAALDT